MATGYMTSIAAGRGWNECRRKDNISQWTDPSSHILIVQDDAREPRAALVAADIPLY